MSPRKPDHLSVAQSDEVARRARWQRPDALRPWDARLVAHAKRWTKVVSVVAGLVGAASALGGAAVKAWRYVRAGGATAPAELPKTGTPTTAMDFVSEPTTAPERKP